MPDTAADTIYDEELDVSPEVLSLLLRRRTASAALASRVATEDHDDRHQRVVTRAHPWF